MSVMETDVCTVFQQSGAHGTAPALPIASPNSAERMNDKGWAMLVSNIYSIISLYLNK